ncbi:hypothetical protein FNF29_07596 [Cafeteria roenbergensis]|uniref:Calcineurin-like phosphoesterase domain-containing protein n=1 Tax=Cafeteria roenbergensis TaxID=33653 RepID=A0A5A8C245_CAFRO|nr:hypothetical protein FNF29_07596 [Cafeteria roenbergensis]|eukprot:KAA0147106.1 hypothetical protein FNF29_07596 [Cafeteria roenbergensis]
MAARGGEAVVRRCPYRIVFTSDNHGNTVQLLLAVDFANACRADVLIIGGDVAPKCQYHGGKEYFSTMEACQRTWLLGPWKQVLRRARATGLRVAYILGNGDVASNYDAHASLEREGLCMLLNCRRRPLPWRDGTPSPLQALGYPFAPLSFSGLKDFEKADRPCTASELVAAKAALEAAASSDSPPDASCRPFEFTPDGAMRAGRTHGRRSTKTVSTRRPTPAAAGAAASSGAGDDSSDSQHGVGQRVVQAWHPVVLDADRAATGETIQDDLAMPLFRSPATAEGEITSALTPDLEDTLHKGEGRARRPSSRERRPSRPSLSSADGSVAAGSSAGAPPPEAGTLLVSDDDSSELWLGDKCTGALPWTMWRLTDDFECQLGPKQIPALAEVGEALRPLPAAKPSSKDEAAAAAAAAAGTARPALGSTAQSRTIFVSHSPPWGSALDATKTGKFVGSASIRRYIEETSPLLSLHGHVHEAPCISGRYFQRMGHEGQTLALCSGNDPLYTMDGLPNTLPVMRDASARLKAAAAARKLERATDPVGTSVVLALIDIQVEKAGNPAVSQTRRYLVKASGRHMAMDWSALR